MNEKDKSKKFYKDGVWRTSDVNPPKDYFQVGEKLISTLKKYPEIIGQIDGKTGKSETYGVIYDKSVRCALWLKKFGVDRNDVVSYCGANCMATCIPLFATFYIGSIFNPWWNSCLNEEISRFFIEQTRPKVLFIDEVSSQIILKVIKNINFNVKIITVDREISGFESLSSILNQININEIKTFKCTKIDNANESALIMFTSGTTSNPKGALHSYGSMVSTCLSVTDEKGISLWFANICWLSAIMSIFHWIFSHSTALIYDSPSEDDACKLTEKFKVTRLTMGTAAMNRFSKTKGLDKYDMSSIQFVFFGGSIAKKEAVEFLINFFKNARITTAYGSTECMGTFGIINPHKPTSCGKVRPNHEIKIIDLETNEIVGSNQEGELYLRGITQIKCYWNNSKATSEVINSDGWYRSGDVGYYDDDGDFYITERIKELIKYRLHHVPPAAIESVILNIPGVAEVGVVAKPHIDDLEQPTAFITKVPGIEITEDDVHKMVNDKLHDRMKLRGGVYFLDEMPHTTTGKIAKRALRDLAKIQVE